MPMPKMPEGPDWTEDDIQAARKRGRKLALEQHTMDPGGQLRLDKDAAFDLIEEEGLFVGRTEKARVTLAFEVLGAAERFHVELQDLAS